MTRTAFPFAVSDVSALARSLQRELSACDQTPGHVQLLNMLARATGYRNFQHFRAQQAAADRLDAPPVAAEPVDHKRVERVARYFDAEGRLSSWPAKTADQRLALWALWARIDPEAVMTERQISDHLRGLHLFGDPALLRRELFQTGLVTRTLDCREYRRVEQKPPAEAAALVRAVGRR
jgi:hypothetical protein